MDALHNAAETEKLRTENEFIKLKLMLENGARFGQMGKAEIPPELENQFLQRILEFEKQAGQPRFIKVFDKIGRPAQFRPAKELTPDELKAAWEELSILFYQHQISLDVVSPSVDLRERYRFATEEFFQFEIEDIHVEGLVHTFIYDDFHPDHAFNNQLRADHLMQLLLGGKLGEQRLPFLQRNSLRFNQHFPLSDSDLYRLLRHFFKNITTVKKRKIRTDQAMVDGKQSLVKGSYRLEAVLTDQQVHWEGNWTVQFHYEEAEAGWMVHEIKIDGLLV